MKSYLSLLLSLCLGIASNHLATAGDEEALSAGESAYCVQSDTNRLLKLPHAIETDGHAGIEQYK